MDEDKVIMKFLFYIVPEGEYPIFQHDAVSLAEGLVALGHEVYGSGNYWYDHGLGGYLLKVAPTSFKPDISIYNASYINLLDPNLNTINWSETNILLDFSDGFRTLSNDIRFKSFRYILRTHYNKNIKYRDNVIPWAFGITNRMIEENDKWIHKKIKKNIFENYRVYYNSRSYGINALNKLLKFQYNILSLITDRFNEKKKDVSYEKSIKSYWWQTYFRHDSQYFEILNSSSFCYCFGGGIIPKIAKNFPTVFEEVYLKFFRRITSLCYMLGIKNSKYYINYQYDSWRFWETLISNSCPITMDYMEWGFVLPVMPINGIHYYGVKGLNYKKCADNILEQSDEAIEQVSLSGREWALKYYSPDPVAKRFINLITIRK